jgi:predicted nucleic acid-binding protein
MIKVFADTGYWIALLNPRDELHDKAVELSRKFSSAKIVTSEMVLVEMLNSLSHAGAHARRISAQAIGVLRANRNIQIWPQTTEQFRNALGHFTQVKDKNWSITDCASFQIMDAANIQEALTSDRHFAQAGFSVLLA